MTIAQQTMLLRKPRKFITSIAKTDAEVREAQRLRWRVFADEGGAALASEMDGYDIDLFDPHCSHILVRDAATDHVIGTYRILTGAGALQTGGFYSETEFDLDRLAHLRPRIAELGRSCVHPDYRSGGVIALLWSAIADVIAAENCDILIGCASVSMRDGGQTASTLYHQMIQTNLAPLEYRVTPKSPIVLAAHGDAPMSGVPPLMKGYMRAGAWVCGAPHWDPDFNTADFFMMLQLSSLDQRYARHYLAPSEG